MESIFVRLDEFTDKSEPDFELPDTAEELRQIVENARDHPLARAPNRALQPARTRAAGERLCATGGWNPNEKLTLLRGPAVAGAPEGRVYVLDGQHRLAAAAKRMSSRDPADVGLVAALRKKAVPTLWLDYGKVTPALVHEFQAALQTAQAGTLPPALHDTLKHMTARYEAHRKRPNQPPEKAKAKKADKDFVARLAAEALWATDMHTVNHLTTFLRDWVEDEQAAALQGLKDVEAAVEAAREAAYAGVPAGRAAEKSGAAAAAAAARQEAGVTSLPPAAVPPSALFNQDSCFAEIPTWLHGACVAADDESADDQLIPDTLAAILTRVAAMNLSVKPLTVPALHSAMAAELCALPFVLEKVGQLLFSRMSAERQLAVDEKTRDVWNTCFGNRFVETEAGGDGTAPTELEVVLAHVLGLDSAPAWPRGAIFAGIKKAEIITLQSAAVDSPDWLLRHLKGLAVSKTPASGLEAQLLSLLDRALGGKGFEATASDKKAGGATASKRKAPGGAAADKGPDKPPAAGEESAEDGEPPPPKRQTRGRGAAAAQDVESTPPREELTLEGDGKGQLTEVQQYQEMLRHAQQNSLPDVLPYLREQLALALAREAAPGKPDKGAADVSGESSQPLKPPATARAAPSAAAAALAEKEERLARMAEALEAERIQLEADKAAFAAKKQAAEAERAAKKQLRAAGKEKEKEGQPAGGRAAEGEEAEPPGSGSSLRAPSSRIKSAAAAKAAGGAGDAAGTSSPALAAAEAELRAALRNQQVCRAASLAFVNRAARSVMEPDVRQKETNRLSSQVDAASRRVRTAETAVAAARKEHNRKQ